jgi:hypothetical protein
MTERAIPGLALTVLSWFACSASELPVAVGSRRAFKASARTWQVAVGAWLAADALPLQEMVGTVLGCAGSAECANGLGHVHGILPWPAHPSTVPDGGGARLQRCGGGLWARHTA